MTYPLHYQTKEEGKISFAQKLFCGFGSLATNLLGDVWQSGYR
jgi:hypothetical protein